MCVYIYVYIHHMCFTATNFGYTSVKRKSFAASRLISSAIQ